MQFLRKYGIWGSILLLLYGCEPKFDLLADAKELYVVYGVLDPDASVQWIKVQQVWQVNGDATLYAAENDLSASGLDVRIEGGGRIWHAIETDEISREPGAFTAHQKLYKIHTPPDSALFEGSEYRLIIQKPGDLDFEPITAVTRIPHAPRLTVPGPPLYNIHTYLYSYPKVDFTDDYVVYFQPSDAMGYEVRVGVEYLKDGIGASGHWITPGTFSQPIRCGRTVGQGEICYEIPGGAIPRQLRKIKQQAGAGFSYWDDPQVAGQLASLSKAAWVEVTAVDSALTRFLASNQAFGFGTNLLLDKADYTNLSGAHIGIFGSFATDRHQIFLSECTKYEGDWLPSAAGFCQ
jgi:hypothetical protein